MSELNKDLEEHLLRKKNREKKIKNQKDKLGFKKSRIQDKLGYY